MMLSNKAYDILKWICTVFLPALITLYGVIANACDIPQTETVMTIAVAVNTFLGTLLGISNINYKRGRDDE